MNRNLHCLIYSLTNKITSKIYIGQTWYPIKIRAGRGYANNSYLHNSMIKYGKQNFVYEILTVCSTQNVADFYEDYFIHKYDTINIGYNIKNGGSRGQQSSETKKKISVANTGKIRTPEQKLTISLSIAGEKHPHYGKKGILSQNFGKKHSNTTKEKRSKITKIIADQIRIEYSTNNVSQKELGNKYGITQDVVSRIILYKIWN